ncbi:MAG: 4-hydroxy-tetrahydrodipicolinate reductase [Bacteroidales bacterium]|nr:4-hydroxy-tetrahydrodipicolinate reductase [Bacteroidales bacterium]
MKIALVGYGKMGKEIEKIAIERGHSIVLTIDINNQQDFTIENLQKADVVIEFTTPATAYNNYLQCFRAGVPVVSGSTGWTDKYDEIASLCKQTGNAFFYSSNYSLGVNIFFEINRKLAAIMNKFPQYDLCVEEVHHNQKLDAPSGTAITIANDILANVERKKSWRLNEFKSTDELQVVSKRLGTVPGTHIVEYDSADDTLEIKHAAKSRRGLAFGAVLAAEFIQGKKGVFGMRDLLDI